MNFVCNKCISIQDRSQHKLTRSLAIWISERQTNKVYVENLTMSDQIKRAIYFPKTVCIKYLSKLAEYKYIRIDQRHPYLEKNQRLKEALFLRRKCHKLFE